jgi:hypothetical protein
MSANPTSSLPAGLADVVQSLPQAAKDELAKLLAEPTEPSPPFELSKEWQDEILRRIAAMDSGEMPTYTLEETMAYLEQVDLESRPQ